MNETMILLTRRDASCFQRLGLPWTACGIYRDQAGRALRWRGRGNQVHAVEVWPRGRGTDETTANTRCRMYEVAPGEAWSGREKLTCAACEAVERDMKCFFFVEALPCSDGEQ